MEALKRINARAQSINAFHTKPTGNRTQGNRTRPETGLKESGLKETGLKVDSEREKYVKRAWSRKESIISEATKKTST